jgi:hypothetical protein
VKSLQSGRRERVENFLSEVCPAAYGVSIEQTAKRFSMPGAVAPNAKVHGGIFCVRGLL